MELSPVIALLSQVFIKCKWGWLLYTFYTWKTDFLSFSLLLPASIYFWELHMYIMDYGKPLWRPSINSGGVLPDIHFRPGDTFKTVTMTRENVQRTVSSRLKVRAIKSVSSPLSPAADRNTNSWIKHSRKRHLKSREFSCQLCFFFFPT